MASISVLDEIDAFLAETGMGASYFGKQATGNSELVNRLRNGRRCWPETEKRVRDFIKTQRRSKAKSTPQEAGEAA